MPIRQNMLDHTHIVIQNIKTRDINITNLAKEMDIDPNIIIDVENGSIEPTLQLILDYTLEAEATIQSMLKRHPQTTNPHYPKKKGLTNMVYRVEVQPDGRYWNIRVPSIHRSTQTKTRDDVETMAKELIATVTGENNPAVDVHMLETITY